MADISALALKVESSGVVKASENLDKMNKSAKESEGYASSLNDAFENMNVHSLAAAAGVGALVVAAGKLTSALIGAGKASIQMYSHFEQVQNGLGTILQDAEKGKALFEDLRAFSFDTTFGVDELADASTQLLNAGVSMDALKPKLKMLGDLAGGSKEKFAELVSIFGKIEMTGKAGAMQLQQLALRGIPIKQVLQDMGVTGVATAEQMTAAFEKMTAEGGQFHNAMQSIIGTIEGKEGFITDTMKEISVNFAEASGLASAYKEALDSVYQKLNDFNNWLARVSANPVYKNIFQGAIVASLAAIAAVVGGAIVPALISAAAQLGVIQGIMTAIAALNPLVLAGVAIGSVAVMAGMKATEEVRKLNAEIKELKKTKDELEERISGGNGTFDDVVAYQEARAALARKELENLSKGLTDANGQKWTDDREIARQNAILANATKKLEILKQQKKQYDEIAAAEARAARELKTWLDNYNATLDNASKTFGTSLMGQLENVNKSIANYQNALKGRVEMVRSDYSGMWRPVEHKPIGDDLRNILYALNEEEKKRNKLKMQIELGANLYPFWEKLQEAEKEAKKSKVLIDVGFITESENLDAQLKELDAKIKYHMEALAEGNRSVIPNLQKEIDKRKELNEQLKIQKELEDARGSLAEAQSNYAIGFASKGDVGEAEMAVLRASIKEAYNKKNIAEENGNTSGADWEQQKIDAYGKELELLERQADCWGVIKAKMSDAFQEMGASQEMADLFAGTLMDIAATQIPNQLVSGLTEIGKALMQGADGGAAMKEIMLNLVQTLLTTLAVTSVQAAMMFIAQSGWAGVPPAIACLAIGGAAGLGAGLVAGAKESKSEATDQAKEQEELLRRLNEQYKDLFKALKEEQEYYLKRRRQINSESANSAAGVKSVNDMILTPEGSFSTSPKDYLIATKNPQGLFGGQMNMSVVINNSMSESAGVTARQTTDENGFSKLVVEVSKKVAGDYATGKNGWDSAIDSNLARRKGRSYA